MFSSGTAGPPQGIRSRPTAIAAKEKEGKIINDVRIAIFKKRKIFSYYFNPLPVAGIILKGFNS